MAEPTSRTDNHAATLAAALSARVAVLADAARDTMTAIEGDRSALEDRYGSSIMADELINAVRGRIEGVAGDCKDLATILDRFKTLAGPTEATEQLETTTATTMPLPAPLPIAPIGGLPPVPSGPSRGEGGGPHLSDGVRLLATQMSVAGATPDEIATRLHEDFGVADADRLVRELFSLPDVDEVVYEEEEYDDLRGNDDQPDGSHGPP